MVKSKLFSGRWGYSGTSDRVRFSVNRKIYIVGFGLYGSIIGPSDFQVNIQVLVKFYYYEILQQFWEFNVSGCFKIFFF